MMNLKALLPLTAAVLFACGGHHHAPTVSSSAAIFVGNWTGNYTQSGTAAHTGTLTVTIARNAAGNGDDLTGTVQDSVGGSGTASGTVADGTRLLLLDAVYGNSNVSSDSYEGTLSIDARGHLVGSLGEKVGGDGQIPTALDLAPVTPTQG